jgi:hypothetical protein
MILEGRFETQRGDRNAISVNIGHILQLQRPLEIFDQSARTWDQPQRRRNDVRGSGG